MSLMFRFRLNSSGVSTLSLPMSIGSQYTRPGQSTGLVLIYRLSCLHFMAVGSEFYAEALS